MIRDGLKVIFKSVYFMVVAPIVTTFYKVKSALLKWFINFVNRFSNRSLMLMSKRLQKSKARFQKFFDWGFNALVGLMTKSGWVYAIYQTDIGNGEKEIVQYCFINPFYLNISKEGKGIKEITFKHTDFSVDWFVAQNIVESFGHDTVEEKTDA